ncbi:hypothetical protein BDW66DRAFT_146603 [Aspergillus desertorum]
MPVTRSVARVRAEKTTRRRASKQQNDLHAVNNTNRKPNAKFHRQQKGHLKAADC